uniref:Uncharacterized protein n=1 Tax=Micrurus lemniscatus lemniscatus TaxID=129467 RepID=A0A2D4HYR8_MICLE
MPSSSSWLISALMLDCQDGVSGGQMLHVVESCILTTHVVHCHKAQYVFNSRVQSTLNKLQAKSPILIVGSEYSQKLNYLYSNLCTKLFGIEMFVDIRTQEINHHHFYRTPRAQSN